LLLSPILAVVALAVNLYQTPNVELTPGLPQEPDGATFCASCKSPLLQFTLVKSTAVEQAAWAVSLFRLLNIKISNVLSSMRRGKWSFISGFSSSKDWMNVQIHYIICIETINKNTKYKYVTQ
jgi:hypothetical protein